MPCADRLALALHSGALTLPPAGNIVVLRAMPLPFLDLIPVNQLLCEQTLRPVHDALASRGLSVTRRAEGPASMVVVLLTRARAEALGNIARALAMLSPCETLVVTGAKVEGVDSLARRVGRILPLEGSFTKHHGRVFWLKRPDPLPAEIAEWRTAAECKRNVEGYLTAPGMFSPDHADPGSVRLAEALDAKIKGHVADLGAGWGWLSAEALRRCPAISDLALFEAEASALDAARQNITDTRASFHWTDVATLDKADGPFDMVICNPPFHQDRAAEPGLGISFIAAASRILKPAGRFFMVANRQLPYEAELDRCFRHWEKLSENRAYKIVAAERPRQSR